MAKASARAKSTSKRARKPKKASKSPKYPWAKVSGLSLIHENRCVANLSAGADGQPIFRMMDRQGRERIVLSLFTDRNGGNYARITVLSANGVGIGMGADTFQGADFIGAGTSGPQLRQHIDVSIGPNGERRVVLAQSGSLRISSRTVLP